jgi:hypothetical protein
MESPESVKAAIGASTRSMAAIVWPSLSDGVMEFTFVMGLAREEVITILVKGGFTNAHCCDEGRGKRLGGEGDGGGGRVAR